MLLNFCILVILALGVSAVFEKLKLPGLLGMLVVGVFIGPSFLDFIHPTIMDLSAELRTFALIVILLRAGFGIKRDALKAVGKRALLLSFIPGVFEGLSILIASRFLLDFTWIQGGILGFIIAAVSPAVVVPQMLSLKEKGYGEDKQIPTLVLAGASLDDIFAITIYTTFLAFYFGKEGLVLEIIKMPVGILLGIGLGLVLGLILVKLFGRLHMRDTKKVMVLLIVCVFFRELEATGWVNTLLGIMTIGFILLESMPVLAGRLGTKLNKLWVLAEIILFVLIGAKVDVSLSLVAGPLGLILIATGLLCRSLGVVISLYGSQLNLKERLFVTMAYTPKATVQAAIGAIPLSMGVAGGDLILAIAVLSILLTAPFGAIMIRNLAPHTLTQGDLNQEKP